MPTCPVYIILKHKIDLINYKLALAKSSTKSVCIIETGENVRSKRNVPKNKDPMGC